MFKKITDFLTKGKRERAAKLAEAEAIIAKAKEAAEIAKTAKTEKEIATAKGQPYVTVLSVELDKENMGLGAFELDWNDLFISKLIRAGYQMDKKDTPEDLVDRWFTDVCRNVVLETWEQYEAINTVADGRVIKSRDIGDGRSEVS